MSLAFVVVHGAGRLHLRREVYRSGVSAWDMLRQQPRTAKKSTCARSCCLFWFLCVVSGVGPSSWTTARTRPWVKVHFLECICVYLWFKGGNGGGRGGFRTSFILRLCPKPWHLPHFHLFVQHTAQGCAQGCGTRHITASVHAFGDHAQNTCIYSVFITLYNILRKDVEQDTLSQASMLLATMPKTLLFTAFCDSAFSDLLKENFKVLDLFTLTHESSTT